MNPVRIRNAPFTLTVLVAFVMVLLLPLAASGTEAEAERDRVRQERAQAAGNVDALNGDKADVEAALRALDEQLQGEQAALANAKREVSEAEEAERRAQEGIETAAARLSRLEDRLRAQMVEAYTDGENAALGVLDAASATDLVKRRAIVADQTAEDDDLADQVRAAEAELRAQRRAAVEAGERAEAKRADVQERIDAVEAARSEQQDFAVDVQRRIDSEIARALELGQRDQELSAQIVREQAELQARLALQRYREQKAREEAAARAAAERAAAERAAAERTAAERAAAETARAETARAEAARAEAARVEAAQAADARAAAAAARASQVAEAEAAQAEAAAAEAEQAAAAEEAAAAQAAAAAPAPAPSAPSSNAGGSESAPVAAPGGVSSAGSGNGVSLCNAGGITVNCQIAEGVRGLIAAAAADGIRLSGGGYRDPSRQIGLREQNCGSSYYAIYQMSSSQCRPPTARPGSSNHELGLAIDFSNCQSRGSSCYQWLRGNASRFGLYNLPAEPWHWSNDGT